MCRIGWSRATTCVWKFVEKEAEVVTISLQKTKNVLIIVATDSNRCKRKLRDDLHLNGRNILKFIYKHMQILLPDVMSNHGMLRQQR